MDSLLTSMPKVELHRHLEGCIRTSTLLELAKGGAIDLPTRTHAELDSLVKLKGPMAGLEQVLAMFGLLRTAFVDLEAVERITREALEDALHRENVRLLELRFSPDFMFGLNNVSWEYGLERIARTCRTFEAETGGTFAVGLVVIASRGLGLLSVRRTAEFALAHRAELAGFDFADGEKDNPAAQYRELASAFHKAGLPLTVHSGEDGGWEHVRDTLELLRPARIGHGVHAVDDPSGHTLELLATRGVCVEVNLVSNYLTGTVARVEDHPLRRFLGAGVEVALCADDPQLLDTDLLREYEAARTAHGLTLSDLVECNARALEASFLSEEKVAPVRRALVDWAAEHIPPVQRSL